MVVRADEARQLHGSADGVGQYLVAVLGSKGLGLVGTLVGSLDLLVQVGAQALGAAADDLVQLALGNQLGFFVLAGLDQQAFDGFDVQAFELALEAVQFGLDGLIGVDQLPILGLEARDLPVQEFLYLAAERCLQRGSLGFVEGQAVGGRVEVKRHVAIPWGLSRPAWRAEKGPAMRGRSSRHEIVASCFVARVS